MRRALITATDRTAIVDLVFQQLSPVAYGPLGAATEYYEPKVKEFLPYNREVAMETLKAASYRLNPTTGLLELGTEPLTLIMIVPTWGYTPQVAQKIQADWRELGITLELRQVPNLAGLLAATQENDYHLVAFNDFGIDPSLLNTFYRTDSRNNFSRVANANLDAWLTRATETLDPAERAALYSGVQGAIMEQALVLPIRDYVNLNAVNRRVGNLQFDAYGWFPLLYNLTYHADAP